MLTIPPVPITSVVLPCSGIQVDLLREDLTHPLYGGNKLRKLFYNVMKAQQGGYHSLLTFGGPWSNHLHASAALCRDLGLSCVGIIRGPEPSEWSDTLSFAKACGMELCFVSRGEYAEKDTDYFKQWLRDQHGRVFIVPEGGSNYLGVQGCAEILGKHTQAYDQVWCAMGTGSTVAGLLLGALPEQQVVGVPMVKGGDGLRSRVESQLHWALGDAGFAAEFMERLTIISDGHRGGFARFDSELVQFMRAFHALNRVRLDPVYTAKLLMKLDEMGESDARKLVVHTGGLQGLAGLERELGSAVYPLD